VTEGAKSPTRDRKPRSTGTKARAHVSDEPNSLIELKKQLEERTRELAESLERQAATAEVLRIISSSPGDLAPAFEAMLANAVRICEASFGNLLLYEADEFRLVALHNAPPAFADRRRREPVIRPHPDTGLARAARTKQAVQIADTRAGPYPSDLVDLAGARTILTVPMLKDEELVGAIGIYRQEVRPFTDKQIELVTNFASQAVIAIENVRLLTELRARTAELEDKSRQLAAASERKSQFLASMSHELRTPLNAIIGLTEMMVSNAARFGTEEPLERVHRAGTHLLGLINQVLDLSKIEAGKLELNPTTVELAPLIEEVIGTARQLAEQNENRFVVEAQENLGTLTVDPMRLKQCLQVHQAGRGHAAGAEGHQRSRLDRIRGGRYRHRHDGGAAGQAVRGVQPG
jgi:K+-sensing histidine kinase KdpD